MKQQLLFVILFMFPFYSYTQNLIPNPSFESYSVCPNSFGQFNNYVNDWTAWRENPDYWNACAINNVASVPNNCAGYQPAASGNAYAGIHTYSGSGTFTTSYREYIGVQLITPLVNQTKYFVTLKISATFLDSNCTTTCKDVCNKMGVLFTKTAYSYFPNPLPITNFAHIYWNTIISDTANWTVMRGSFTADSIYSFCALGNFFPDDSTNAFTMNPAGYGQYSYYYIDDVCVSTDSLYCELFTGTNEIRSDYPFKVFPNPVSDKLYFKIPEKNNKVFVKIYDETFRTVFQRVINNPEQKEININNFQQGIYYIEIQTSSKVYKKLIMKINR